jgi:hypothetical protein
MFQMTARGYRFQSTASEYYQDPNAALRAGTDKMLPMGYGENYWADASAGTMTALREAAHHTLYALTNSNAMIINTGMPAWLTMLLGFDALILILLALWEIVTLRSLKQ